jgi:Fic family protein
MSQTHIIKPFSHPFLSQFLFVPELLPFRDEEIISLDKDLSTYEQVFLNPEVERSLMTKNELLASFAISKAEDSQLTMKEAQDVYSLVLSDPTYDFVGKKLKAKIKLTQKDHDQLEFFNIAKTFRTINQHPFSVNKISPQLLLDIHRQLTQGLDIFKKYLPDFTVYKSGMWRDNDLIRVGEYIPAPHKEIENGVTELIAYLKTHQTITGVAIFHTSLYGLHPFNNGNKRICRIVEHVLLRSLGLNTKNLYSTSYYYYSQKARYYKYLLYSLERKNLNHFVSFVLEALSLSVISVLKTSLEVKRGEFLDKQELGHTAKTVFNPLIKRRELQFKHLERFSRGKVARQTLVNYLQKAVEDNVLTRRAQGRTTYYGLRVSPTEYATLEKWLAFAKQRLSFIPDDIKLI